MANFFKSTYDPQVDAASSSVEVSDLNPQKSYDTDLRRVDEDSRLSVQNINVPQERIGKYFRAAKTAEAYKTRAGIAEPTIGGKTPRNPAVMDISSYGSPFGGTVLPSMGDTVGQGGSTNYAQKPGRAFGNI